MADVPTMSLRFVWRYVPAPQYGPNISQKTRVLQQLFETSQGREWRDVPLVEDA